jgi:hypothetical protein
MNEFGYNVNINVIKMRKTFQKELGSEGRRSKLRSLIEHE